MFLASMSLVLALAQGSVVSDLAWQAWRGTGPNRCVLSTNQRYLWSFGSKIRRFDVKTGVLTAPESVFSIREEKSGKKYGLTTSQVIHHKTPKHESSMLECDSLVAATSGEQLFAQGHDRSGHGAGFINWAKRGQFPNRLVFLPRVRAEDQPDMLNMVKSDVSSCTVWVGRLGYKRTTNVAQVRISMSKTSGIVLQSYDLPIGFYKGVLRDWPVSFKKGDDFATLTHLHSKKSTVVKLPARSNDVLVRGVSAFAFASNPRGDGIWRLDPKNRQWKLVAQAEFIAASSDGQCVAVCQPGSKSLKIIKLNN